MESMNVQVFSIIVKIWVEDADQPTWHGRVTHIPSGEQWYVKRPEDVAQIINRYLTPFNIKPGMRTRIQQWLRRLWDHSSARP